MLSKSQYIKYRSCPRRLWLQCNKKEVLALPDATLQKIFDRGHFIGELARKCFPGGVLVKDGYKNPQEALKRTRELMSRGVPAIYEAAFIYKDILVFVDILEKTPSGWNLVEVKSSGRTIDAIYVDDISIQRYVLTHCGVTPEHCCLMHINTDYFMETDEPDLKQFFLLTFLDDELFPDEDIEKNLQHITELLAGPEPPAKLDKTGCSACECRAYCWKDIPEGSVFEILRSNKAREYMAQGRVRVADLPLNSFSNEKLNHWIEVYRTGRPYMDRAAIARWLNQLTYPLYYLDFETTQPVVPLWKYSRPYQQIPFQFSLHVQRDPNGEFEHYEYLSTGKEDPRKGCVDSLLQYIGKEGTIIAHNAAFEKGRLKEMAADLSLPKEKKDALHQMIMRFMDTLDIFRRDYLHPKMRGSASIKKVLPALVPEMSYEGMGVADGVAAMEAFDILYAQSLPSAQLERLRNDLLRYCEQDTWAMVKLVDALRTAISS